MLFLPHTSLAKTESSSCNFKPEIFASLQKKKWESAETVRSELEIRKNVLNAALLCLEEEAGGVYAELNRTSVKEARMQAVREHFIAGLEDALRYYESERCARRMRGPPAKTLREASEMAPEYLLPKTRIKAIHHLGKQRRIFDRRKRPESM